jgi:3',5'-cyclic AMP phosphodiesterase CpdA
MIHLAHVSDIHITAHRLDWRLPDFFNRRLASWFNLRFMGREFRFRHAEEVLTILMGELRQRGIEHILFSGDATALGFESEIRRASELLQVSQWTGLAVPGNHDYCNGRVARSGLFERYFAAWQTGERIDAAKYPFAQRLGDVWFVGVNSATGNVTPWDAAGSVGPEQLARLEKLLAQLPPGPRIIVTHYPVCLPDGKREHFYHGLRDLDAVVPVAVRGGVVLWLHGHRHTPYIMPRTDLAPFPIICTGSSTQTDKWSYCEYVIDDGKVAGTRRSFDAEQKCFRGVETFQMPLALPSSGK